MRTGVIAKKLGMSRVFDASGVHIPVTVLALGQEPVTLTVADTLDGGDVPLDEPILHPPMLAQPNGNTWHQPAPSVSGPPV